VVAANYNCPGQLVISGYVEAVKAAVDIAKEEGARMAMLLPVSGGYFDYLIQFFVFLNGLQRYCI